MATINPFYRFEDARQVGSLGERGRIVSLALDSIYGSINVSHVGQTISQVKNACQLLADQYNIELQANFVVDCFYTIDAVNPYPVQIFIYDSVLADFYPLHKVSLILIVDPSTGLTTNSSAWWMGAIPSNYNYSEPLCNEELEAYNALIQYAETGSAIFPKTYTFDKVTGVASSLMSRLRPCKYDVAKGTAVRFPADTYARAAKPNLQFPKLSGAGSYIIKLFNSLIEMANVTGTTIGDLYNSMDNWSAPEGYYFLRNTDFTPIERFQITMYSATESFALVVRDDSGFQFQRFYAPKKSLFNFMSGYSDTLDLPYQPDGLYRYGNAFYDFDFCEFNNCAYPAKESYLMPIKSGDELQFNVLPYQSNVLTNDNVNVGIFDSNFNLVQKIGETSKLEDITCVNTEFKCSHEFSKTISLSQFDLLLYNIAQLMEEELLDYWYVLIKFELKNSNNDVIKTIGYTLVNDTQSISQGLYIAALQSIGIGVTMVGANVTFKYLAQNLPCDETYTFKEFAGFPIADELMMEFDEFECVCPTSTIIIEQQNAKSLIPKIKDGCYRFGLYKYKANLWGAEIEVEPGLFPIANAQYNVIVIFNNSTSVIKYMVAIPYNVTSFEQFIQYMSRCFPGTIKKGGTNVLTELFTLCGYNSAFTDEDYLQFGTYDFSTDTFSLGLIGTTASTICSTTEEEPINEVYSFSNLISLDNSDCFSTMIQFWAESNAIAEGFEYYNDWHQQVRLGINGGGRKPVINESTYRQSNGVTRRPQNKQDLSIDLHTDFLDFETQSALVDATRHTNFVVDGQNLFVNGDIEVATIQDFTTQSSFEDLAQVKFSALIQGYQPKNSTCVNC